ncbi:oligopeptide ABC transporter permease OppB [Solimonas sp. SE-A11]|uniref:oligopeptide ABC transporter permease OppB n=1 Tax=Solimonas sp. SE-A11 TaxID=3054954 RepID=UPI00259CEEC9|nr:oligopeptide ABC transporter permease OppB [Solimonas sp. SE-A11]MDM4772480.1 oligopeptide ABC transporter permease OppB [Solimonas sp. SE-A11]
MLRFAMRRLLASIPTLLVLITLAFFMMRLAPGGPFDKERSLLPEIEAAINSAYHLDEPLWQQYLRYMGGLLQGDLGPSFQYAGFSVSELIAQGFPVSLAIGLSSMVLALLVGGAAGIWAAMRQNRLGDWSVMTLSMAGISLPSYVIAPLMILLFAVTLHWLPAGGWEQGRYLDMLMPVLALALPQIAYIARLMRGSMIEVLRSNFIRTARAKGLPERRVILRHALKPAMMPILSFLGPTAAGVITGSVVIEQIFGIPGLGRYFVQAAINRDYTLVLGVVIFYGLLIVLFNFLVDLLYGALDPRVRVE